MASEDYDFLVAECDIIGVGKGREVMAYKNFYGASSLSKRFHLPRASPWLPIKIVIEIAHPDVSRVVQGEESYCAASLFWSCWKSRYLNELFHCSAPKWT